MKKEKKKTNKYYFNEDTEASILEYNSLQDTDTTEAKIRREYMFNTFIHPAFKKLAENLIHTYKFYHYETTINEFKHEIICHLIEKLQKFTPDKGKAFSYFDRIAINFCIIQNNLEYAKRHQHTDIEVGDSESDTAINRKLHSIEESEYIEDDLYKFFDMYVEYWETRITDTFDNPEDAKIADAVLILFKNRDKIDLMSNKVNKKALYLMIREITGIDTNKITKVVNILKDSFGTMYQHYLKYETLPAE